MGKNSKKNQKMRQKFQAFIDTLSEREVRKELLAAYMQMERCIDILDGKDTQPVVMKDNGVSSDLELFYRCKKVAESSVMLAETAEDMLTQNAKRFIEEQKILNDVVFPFNISIKINQ